MQKNRRTDRIVFAITTCPYTAMRMRTTGRNAMCHRLAVETVSAVLLLFLLPPLSLSFSRFRLAVYLYICLCLSIP